MLIWNSFGKIYILAIKNICSFHVNFAFKVHVPFVDPWEKKGFIMFNLLSIKIQMHYITLFLVYILGTMPLLKNRLLPLRTISLRYIARNLELFWKEEWDPHLQEVTEASDDILLDIRKEYLN